MKAVLAGLLAAASLAAQQPEISKGFDHFYNLEFEEAIQVFSRLIERNPKSPALYNHLAQSMLFREMLHAGALESELVTGGNSFLRREKMNPSPERQRQFHEAVSRAMTLAQKRLDANPLDKEGLYHLGVAHGLRANYNFLVRKAWMDALRDATEGRKLHNQLTEIDPAMIDARLMQGAHDYVVGSLPFFYKILGFLAGFRGDREEGIATLKLVAEKGDRNRADAAILLAVIYRRERRASDAVPLLAELIGQFPRNYLLRLEMAQMYSDLGEKQKALNVLAEVERMKRADLPGYRNMPIEKVYYFRGNLQFWYNDLDEAIANLLKVTARAEELDLNTGVLAWMRLGQSYDLKGQRGKAVEAYRQAVEFAPESEVGKESRRYISSPYRRKSSG